MIVHIPDKIVILRVRKNHHAGPVEFAMIIFSVRVREAVQHYFNDVNDNNLRRTGFHKVPLPSRCLMWRNPIRVIIKKSNDNDFLTDGTSFIPHVHFSQGRSETDHLLTTTTTVYKMGSRTYSGVIKEMTSIQQRTIMK